MLIVGLGNPGARYADTRHNIGFMAVDALAERAGNVVFKPKFSADFGQGTLKGKSVGFLKPTTFMNLSGESVQPALAFYKYKPEDLIVIHDELDVPFGQVRLKSGGGDAGHRGLRSITGRLGTPEYVRLRLGIGRPPPDFRGDVADFVLQGFAPTERTELNSVIGRAVEAVELLISQGLSAAMNQTNQRSR